MFSRVAQPVGGIAALAVLGAACVKQLPAAPTPEAVAPPGAVAAPPAATTGRLVVDVVDGPSAVHRVHMAAQPVAGADGRVRYRFSEAPELLCPASPCVADLAPGNLLLGFPVLGNNQLETELVHIDPGTTVYRRSLSRYEDNSGALRVVGIVSTSVGAAAAITGIVLLPIGLSDDSDGLATGGGITLAAGAALLGFGIWAIRRDSPTYRPGSANHFPLPAL